MEKSFMVALGTKGVGRDMTRLLRFFPYIVMSDCVFTEHEYKGMTEGARGPQYVFSRGVTEYTIPVSAVRVVNG